MTHDPFRRTIGGIPESTLKSEGTMHLSQRQPQPELADLADPKEQQRALATIFREALNAWSSSRDAGYGGCVFLELARNTLADIRSIASKQG